MIRVDHVSKRYGGHLAVDDVSFTIRDGEVFEEHVALDGQGRFLRTDRPADPMLAAAVRHVADAGRDALGEMRRMLGVLTGPADSAADRSPQPDVCN